MKIVKPKIGAIEVKSDKPVQMLKNEPDRKGLLVYNNGTDTVELLSSPQGKFGDGIPVLTGSRYEDDEATGSFWIIARSGTQDIRVQEDVEEQCQP